MKLTYAIWNTLGGGTDADSDARLRRQMALLASFSPSAVGLQECKYWDRDYYRTFHLAEQLLGMRGFLSPSAHHGCHLAIFVREDVGLRVTEQRHEHGHPYWHGAARIVVHADGHPGPLQLASVHLAPSNPAIIGGDFNALPASDPGPPAAEGRLRRKLDRGPAEALEETGFHDAGAHANDPTPTAGARQRPVLPLRPDLHHPARQHDHRLPGDHQRGQRI